MKKVIKKISAIAMAFTLLGTGTTIAKNVNPKLDNTLTASAATSIYGPYSSLVVNGHSFNSGSYYFKPVFGNGIIVLSSSMEPLYFSLRVNTLSFSC